MGMNLYVGALYAIMVIQPCVQFGQCKAFFSAPLVKKKSFFFSKRYTVSNAGLYHLAPSMKNFILHFLLQHTTTTATILHWPEISWLETMMGNGHIERG